MVDNLSVFLPTFNEEGNIKQSVSKVVSVLGKVARKWEIIIVDDGSTDTTSKITNELAKNDSRIRVIHHGVNRGYGSALKTGFENAKYSWVAFMDSDRQFDFSEIKKFIAKKDEADLILGYRLKRADSLARRLFTFGWSTLARLMLGLKARDYSCGFKMIKKKVYEDIQPLAGEEKVTQIEMLVKARKMGFNFVEVGVHHFPRVSGKPTGAKLKVVIKSLYDLLGLWRRLHNISKKELLAVFAILAIGAILRLYRIGDYMTFLGDEGRDAIIVRRLLVNFDPILIGPGTSIGSMYLGPLYYYLIAPSLFLANYSPIGPSIFIALIGIATIYFVYHVGKEWFPSTSSGPSAPGLVTAALYAVSPVVIIYSRSSWNPNIMPFFSLLSVYSIWRVWRYKQYKWLLVLGVSYAFVLQSHYLGLLLAPVLLLFWFLSRPPIRYSLFAISLFAFLMSPLVIFDARHGWNNFAAMKKFFAERQTTVSARPWSAIPKMYPIFQDANTSLLTAKNVTVGKWLTLGVVLYLAYLFVFKRSSILHPTSYILLSWLSFGLLGLGLYKQQIYDHYYGFIFPAFFLLFAFLLSQLNKFLVMAISFSLLIISLKATPIGKPPTMQMRRAIEVSNKISEESMGKPFNIAVVAERNYEDGYQYFLEKNNNPVVEIDAQLSETVTDQLFVVCEMLPEKCDPTHSSKAEVANFGWSKIETEWKVYGVRLYKLGHTK